MDRLNFLSTLPSDNIKYWNRLLNKNEKIAFKYHPTVNVLGEVSGILAYTYTGSPVILQRYLAIRYHDGITIYCWENDWISSDKMLRIVALKAFL